MSMTTYLEERYDETFESVYTVLHDLAQKDRAAAGKQIRQTLKSLYIRQGNDWTGRGAIGNAGLDASVAAHEAVLAELDAVKGESDHERET